MADYILIDAETRAPVPLPYETSLYEKPVRVTGVLEERQLLWVTYNEVSNQQLRPEIVGLALITEADFMAEREQ